MSSVVDVLEMPDDEEQEIRTTEQISAEQESGSDEDDDI